MRRPCCGGSRLPAADIDILLRDRAGVDAWFDALSIDFDVETAPVWIPAASQYFVRLHAQGIPVELSTVEVETDRETMECFGTGPWEHFDLVPYRAARFPRLRTSCACSRRSLAVALTDTK